MENKHHDKRHHIWSVSLSDEEHKTALALKEESGLKKTAFARQALTRREILSRVSKQDREQIVRMNRCHTTVNEIAKVLLKMKKENHSEESLVGYLKKSQEQIDRIESDCADIANYFASLFGEKMKKI